MYTVNHYDDFAALVLYAATMYDQSPDDLEPLPDSRIEDDGWKLKAYIYSIGYDLIGENRNKFITVDKDTYFGYIAEKIDNSGEYVITLRGTRGFAEYIEDADMDYKRPWPDTPSQKVCDGFHTIYQSLRLIVPDNTTDIDYSQLALADAIAQFIGEDAYYTISGHSLGAAMGTYLMRDIYDKPPHGRFCSFASPRTGNNEFVTYVNEHFRDSAVINFVQDVVPIYPIFAEQLPSVVHIYPRDDVIITDTMTDTITCHHTILTYLALLNKYKFFDVVNANIPVENQTWNKCLQVTWDNDTESNQSKVNTK
ncbi:MAG: lipase family protein [Enterobacteriaceae bacterium]|jgi:hypothetical protein|nr:lipase family protein [Enterobacteriaceae bacterium]